MSDGTMNISHVLDNIKSCLESNDIEAAHFLRDGLIEAMSYEQTWLSVEEEAFLASY